jgi:hypothetical protein
MDCQEHTQRGSSKGYGSVWWNGKPEKAHRAAYMGAHSCSLVAGTVVRHTCDNPRCINPDHLELGTVYDNNKDRDERGRTARGEQARSKLTEDTVLKIREEYAAGGCTHRSLAEKYGVESHRTIGSIINRLSWSHIISGS